MQRSQTLQLVRTLRATSRTSTRQYSAAPATESGFPTGEQFVANRAAIREHAAHTTSLWRNISIFACIPIIGGGAYWVWEAEKKHAAHKAEHHHEYIEYAHLNRRTREFPWGKNSLFFNPHTQKDMSGEEGAEH